MKNNIPEVGDIVVVSPKAKREICNTDGVEELTIDTVTSWGKGEVTKISEDFRDIYTIRCKNEKGHYCLAYIRQTGVLWYPDIEFEYPFFQLYVDTGRDLAGKDLNPAHLCNCSHPDATTSFIGIGSHGYTVDYCRKCKKEII